jgi:hypothetical protein
MVSSSKDMRGMGVTTAILVAAGRAATVDLSVLNSVANKAKDRAWKLGDQAMRKCIGGDASAINRGCI